MYLIYFIPWQLFTLTDAKIIRFLASGNLLSGLSSPFDMALIVLIASHAYQIAKLFLGLFYIFSAQTLNLPKELWFLSVGRW